ncbi:hypothetical protein Purlil1_6921 [Purpureocillium lilacinum]|uniref:Uncharacterized protein n=1 Tax=Purpureocillium lilacinum TaxID=33203 RepID=A0ABR0BXK6_PURLI|nr:hypothetical protein Purlil1_6921 [Purpureocillium lilacinum]
MTDGPDPDPDSVPCPAQLDPVTRESLLRSASQGPGAAKPRVQSLRVEIQGPPPSYEVTRHPTGRESLLCFSPCSHARPFVRDFALSLYEYVPCARPSVPLLLESRGRCPARGTAAHGGRNAHSPQRTLLFYFIFGMYMLYVGGPAPPPVTASLPDLSLICPSTGPSKRPHQPVIQHHHLKIFLPSVPSHGSPLGPSFSATARGLPVADACLPPLLTTQL